ncbi:hypothetical protein ASE39_02480 [Acidovorax sp. Root267]|nr:hypothetical protein ASE39_02480 [Acidovorax sp. Root267]
MSAPVNPTMQQLADSVRVPRRTFLQSAGVRRYDCHEHVKAVHGGLLPLKHSEMQAKALSQDEQRESLSELPTMAPRQRHDLVAIIKSDLMFGNHEAKRRGAKQ